MNTNMRQVCHIPTRIINLLFEYFLPSNKLQIDSKKTPITVLLSNPYALVSSDVSHISRTVPSSITYFILSVICDTK